MRRWLPTTFLVVWIVPLPTVRAAVLNPSYSVPTNGTCGGFFPTQSHGGECARLRRDTRAIITGSSESDRESPQETGALEQLLKGARRVMVSRVG